MNIKKELLLLEIDKQELKKRECEIYIQDFKNQMDDLDKDINKMPSKVLTPDKRIISGQ